MQSKTKHTFFKIISGIVLIQGVLQLLSFITAVTHPSLITSSAVKFYLGIALIGVYAIAAIVGGYTGLKDGNTYEGCRRCFYVSIILTIVTCITIILNIIFKVYAITQLEALIIPIAYMIFSILCGRKN